MLSQMCRYINIDVTNFHIISGSTSCLFQVNWPINYWACLTSCPIACADWRKDEAICQQHGHSNDRFSRYYHTCNQGWYSSKNMVQTYYEKSIRICYLIIKMLEEHIHKRKFVSSYYPYRNPAEQVLNDDAKVTFYKVLCKFRQKIGKIVPRHY